MRTITGCLLLVVLLLYFTSYTDSKSKHQQVKRANVCTRIEKFEKTYAVPKTKKIKEYYRTWCFAIPPLCTEYRWKIVSVVKNITVNQTRIAYDCCKGYEKVDESCIPFCPLGCGHGECVEPDVCLCDPGWRQPFCANECEPNRYGRGCMNNCSCLNGGTCDKIDGSCSCIEGFVGTYCELPCPDTMYGKDCHEKCQCQNGAMCDIKDGTCDCEPGYYGEYCENICDLGTHGKDCMFECICLPESTSTCDPVNGECVCRPGYEGQYCERECSNFTYGRNCQRQCDCINAEFCDPINGNCVCKPGWTGITCAKPCRRGTFGEDCMFKCAKCPNKTSTCNPVSGYCDCPPGSFGDSCELGCKEGYWGSNCSETCECSTNEICNPRTGHCTCSPGWRLPNCSEPCNSGRYGYNCSLECNCTSGDSCNATSGSCSSHLAEVNETQDSFVFGLIGILAATCFLVIIVVVVIYVFKPEMITALSSVRGYFSNRMMERCKGGTSTDNIVAENFVNPLYACPDVIQKSDAASERCATVDNILPSTSGLQKRTSQTENINDVTEKSSNHSYEEVSENDKKNASSGMKPPLNISTIGCLVRKVTGSIGHAGKKSDSTDTLAAGIKQGFVPEVLGDFKIPEDDTYESVLDVCRKIENEYREVLPFQE